MPIASATWGRVAAMLLTGLSGVDSARAESPVAEQPPLSPPPLVEAPPQSEPARRAPLFPRRAEPKSVPEGEPPGPAAPAPPPEAPGADVGAMHRIGPAMTLNGALVSIQSGGTEAGFFGGLVKLGARASLVPRQGALSVAPTVALLAVADLQRDKQGLGLEARFGGALVQPKQGFFPTLELYALLAGGFAGPGMSATEAWLRAGVGLQLNLYTLLTRQFGAGELALGFFQAIGAYYGWMFGRGLGGGWGGGGGWGAACIIAAIFVLIIVPPLAILAAMGLTFAGMVANVELTGRFSTDAQNPALAELRFGIGF